MSSLAIIPARGGSKRIPKKNIKPFLGKPIIAYSIECAIQSRLFDKVIVSTDDSEIAEISQNYGAEVPFLRSEKNADDHATTVDVIKEVLLRLNEFGNQYENCCCIYPTAPFVSVSRLNEAFELMNRNNYDVVLPVQKYSFPIQRAVKIHSNKKVSMFYSEHADSRSQDLEDSFHDAGQFYFFKTGEMITNEKLWTNNTGAIIISEMEGQDIDNFEDWKLAELKYEALKSK